MTQRQKAENRDYLLQYNFGITSEEYEAILRRQNGVCAICKKPDGQDLHSPDKFKRLGVDHDHKTGAIRGLLCTNCNRGLGCLQDSVDLLKAAADYIDRHEQRLMEVRNDLGVSGDKNSLIMS